MIADLSPVRVLLMTLAGWINRHQQHVIDLRSRRVHVVGVTPTPDAGFMAQAARRLTGAVDGWPARHRILIGDRDSKCTGGFRRIVEGAGGGSCRTPIQAPNANAYAGRFVRSIREECRDRLILFESTGCAAPLTTSWRTIMGSGIIRGSATS
jgi:hypothetical protein